MTNKPSESGLPASGSLDDSMTKKRPYNMWSGPKIREFNDKADTPKIPKNINDIVINDNATNDNATNEEPKLSSSIQTTGGSKIKKTRKSKRRGSKKRRTTKRRRR